MKAKEFEKETIEAKGRVLAGEKRVQGDVSSCRTMEEIDMKKEK